MVGVEEGSGWKKDGNWLGEMKMSRIRDEAICSILKKMEEKRGENSQRQSTN